MYNLKHLYTLPQPSTYDPLDLSVLIFTHLGPVVLMLIVQVSLLPVTMTKLTVITNIEMMKDNEAIEKVIGA